MYVVVLKDFSAFKAWDVLRQEEDKKWFKCDRAAEHIDVINALPEYYYKVGEDVSKERNCSCIKTMIAIDPANGTDEGCCILAEYEWNAMRILECMPLHICSCAKKFTKEYVHNYSKGAVLFHDNLKVAESHIARFLDEHDLLSN